jgi:hypothetical protein
MSVMGFNGSKKKSAIVSDSIILRGIGSIGREKAVTTTRTSSGICVFLSPKGLVLEMAAGTCWQP